MLKSTLKKAAVFLLATSVSFTTVQFSVAAKKPILSSKKLTLSVGESKKIKVKNAKKISFRSKDKTIATVNKKGLVKGINEGAVKIVVKADKKTLTCSVTVKKSGSGSDPSPSAAPTASPATVKTAAPTLAPSVTPTTSPTSEPTIAPTENPFPDNPETKIVWPEGMKSGLVDDFNNYFKLDMTEYDRKKGTKLGTMNTISYYSEVIGADRECFVFLPPEYDESKEYPVIYMIHGLGCTGGQWVNMNIRSSFSAMIGRGEVKPFIAVIPSVVPKDGLSQNTYSSENIGAFTGFIEEFSKDLEPYIKKNYSISEKPEDTGVCGLSMGGMEALSLGFSLKNHFNFIGSFSAAPTLDTSCLNIKNWDFAPEVVMVCTGDKDETVGDNPYNYHMTLKENGVEHIWYLYPGGTHSDPVWKNAAINFVRYSLGETSVK